MTVFTAAGLLTLDREGKELGTELGTGLSLSAGLDLVVEWH